MNKLRQALGSVKARFEKHHEGGRRENRRSFFGLKGRDYYKDHNGTIHRRTPKRDKSMSARQWKRQLVLLRYRAKVRAIANGTLTPHPTDPILSGKGHKRLVRHA